MCKSVNFIHIININISKGRQPWLLYSGVYYVFVFLYTKSSFTYFWHMIEVYMSDRYDTDLGNHTVVIWKM